jgi:hypothetical protein
VHAGGSLIVKASTTLEKLQMSKAPNKEEVFAYLDTLRESGVTNMFGAGPYLEGEFGVSRREARDLLLEWIETYATRSQL